MSISFKPLADRVLIEAAPAEDGVEDAEVIEEDQK